MRLRPSSHLLRDGIIAAVVFLTPVFLVSYVLTADEGTWPILLALQGLATVVVCVASIRYFMAGIWIEPDWVAERGFFTAMRRIPRERISLVVRAETFGHGADLVPQLFVCDQAGRTLLRMRGQFWSRHAMSTVSDALRVPVQNIAGVVSIRELAAEHPGLPYWFERNRLHLALAITAGTVALAAMVVAALVTL
jgi:hypothetical protein